MISNSHLSGNYFFRVYEYEGASICLEKSWAPIGPQERQAGHQTIHITPCVKDFSGNGELSPPLVQ